MSNEQNQASLAEQYAKLQDDLKNAKTAEEQAQAREALNDFFMINRKFIQFAGKQAGKQVAKQQFWKYVAIGSGIAVIAGVAAYIKHHSQNNG